MACSAQLIAMLACTLALLAAQLGGCHQVHASELARLWTHPETDAKQVDAYVGRMDAGRVEPSRALASASCSTAREGRTAARAFWAIVAIALLLAHHQRQQRRRSRGCTPSRRFRL